MARLPHELRVGPLPDAGLDAEDRHRARLAPGHQGVRGHDPAAPAAGEDLAGDEEDVGIMVVADLDGEEAVPFRDRQLPPPERRVQGREGGLGPGLRGDEGIERHPAARHVRPDPEPVERGRHRIFGGGRLRPPDELAGGDLLGLAPRHEPPALFHEVMLLDQRLLELGGLAPRVHAREDLPLGPPRQPGPGHRDPLDLHQAEVLEDLLLREARGGRRRDRHGNRDGPGQRLRRLLPRRGLPGPQVDLARLEVPEHLLGDPLSLLQDHPVLPQDGGFVDRCRRNLLGRRGPGDELLHLPAEPGQLRLVGAVRGPEGAQIARAEGQGRHGHQDPGHPARRRGTGRGLPGPPVQLPPFQLVLGGRADVGQEDLGGLQRRRVVERLERAGVPLVLRAARLAGVEVLLEGLPLDGGEPAVVVVAEEPGGGLADAHFFSVSAFFSFSRRSFSNFSKMSRISLTVGSCLPNSIGLRSQLTSRTARTSRRRFPPIV